MTSANVTIVYWRDIPAQVIAKGGGDTRRLPLEGRFMEAIDMAAMRSDSHSSGDYTDGWRHGEPQKVDGDADTAAHTTAKRLETEYDRERLKKLISAGGHEES